MSSLERGSPPYRPAVVRIRALDSAPRGRLAQLVRAPALQAGGRRFESCTAHHSSSCLSVGYEDSELLSCSSCFWLCPKLCPPSLSTATKTASSEGCTYRADIVTLMPSGPISLSSDSEKPSTPTFAAASGARPAGPMRPAIEVT